MDTQKSTLTTDMPMYSKFGKNIASRFLCYKNTHYAHQTKPNAVHVETDVQKSITEVINVLNTKNNSQKKECTRPKQVKIKKTNASHFFRATERGDFHSQVKIYSARSNS